MPTTTLTSFLVRSIVHNLSPFLPLSSYSLNPTYLLLLLLHCRSFVARRKKRRFSAFPFRAFSSTPLSGCSHPLPKPLKLLSLITNPKLNFSGATVVGISQPLKPFSEKVISALSVFLVNDRAWTTVCCTSTNRAESGRCAAIGKSVSESGICHATGIIFCGSTARAECFRKSSQAQRSSWRNGTVHDSFCFHFISGFG